MNSSKANTQLYSSIEDALREYLHSPDPSSLTTLADIIYAEKAPTPVKARETERVEGVSIPVVSEVTVQDTTSIQSTEGDEDEISREKRARAAGRGRRAVVFSEAIKLEANWKPVVVPKTDEERAELTASVESNILFQGIDADSRRIIVDAMSPKVFNEGDTIIRQGDPGDYYYIIAEGACQVLVNGNPVLEVNKGRGFGELALLYDAPRAATICAITPIVRTWAIDRVTFKQVMMGTTMRKREMYAAFFSSVPILSTLSQDEINGILDAVQPVTFSAGEVVVRQGDTDADRFYIVEEGELKAEIAGVAGEVCQRLTRSHYFGERALLTDAPRAATITAVRDSKCLVMDRASFVRLMGPLSELLKRSMDLYQRYNN